ncbi:MAG: O-acetyl-ADP-ribose deacetylase [Clostridia bacterium]|nr:O-acetyl-ADP-ribose deacetylase [Clostridia bacterium]
MKAHIKNVELLLKKGDITLEDTDAIVNAANSGLLGGGGVDGAIHRAGGPQIMEECKKIRETKGGCPTGQAVITNAGKLKCKFVIHTVGPIWGGGNKGEDTLLTNAYNNSLKLADEYDIKSIAFPSISTGVYRFPIKHAAQLAIQTVMDYIENQNRGLETIKFILFTENDYNIYRTVLESKIKNI